MPSSTSLDGIFSLNLKKKEKKGKKERKQSEKRLAASSGDEGRRGERHQIRRPKVPPKLFSKVSRDSEVAPALENVSEMMTLESPCHAEVAQSNRPRQTR